MGHYLTNVPIQIFCDQDNPSQIAPASLHGDKTIIFSRSSSVVSDIKNSVFADAEGPEWNP